MINNVSTPRCFLRLQPTWREDTVIDLFMPPLPMKTYLFSKNNRAKAVLCIRKGASYVKDIAQFFIVMYTIPVDRLDKSLSQPHTTQTPVL